MDKVFNEWTIGECIGEGAFGKVYQITREDFGHTYYAALKVIEIPQSQSEVEGLRNDGMQESEIEGYFQSMIEDIVNEFALMSELKGNSNIVSYEDHTVVKKEDGFGWTIYIRMELLTPLFTHIRQKKMTIRDVIQLGIDICTALEVCQKYNIIHRDIKPENIFISNIGIYKLGDFGIARQLEKTSTGLSKKGTIPYMAPEVYKGVGYNSTVDIYSLGLVLYRFLNNNRSPFLPPAPQPIKYSDKQRADIMRMSGQPLPKPCYADGRLAEIVLKACEYNPKYRYETASEMKNALSALLYTEAEKNLIYPNGDLLENKSVHYLTERSADISEMVADSQVNVVSPQVDVVSSQEEDSGTVYLFQGEKKLQEKSVSTAESAEIEAQQVVQNGEVPATDISAVQEVERQLINQDWETTTEMPVLPVLPSHQLYRNSNRQWIRYVCALLMLLVGVGVGIAIFSKMYDVDDAYGGEPDFAMPTAVSEVEETADETEETVNTEAASETEKTEVQEENPWELSEKVIDCPKFGGSIQIPQGAKIDSTDCSSIGIELPTQIGEDLQIQVSSCYEDFYLDEDFNEYIAQGSFEEKPDERVIDVELNSSIDARTIFETCEFKCLNGIWYTVVIQDTDGEKWIDYWTSNGYVRYSFDISTSKKKEVPKLQTLLEKVAGSIRFNHTVIYGKINMEDGSDVAEQLGYASCKIFLLKKEGESADETMVPSEDNWDDVCQYDVADSYPYGWYSRAGLEYMYVTAVSPGEYQALITILDNKQDIIGSYTLGISVPYTDNGGTELDITLSDDMKLAG